MPLKKTCKDLDPLINKAKKGCVNYTHYKNALFEAWAYCDLKEKSTSFMLQYMQDRGGVSLDYVLLFVEKESENRKEWYSENKNWTDKYNN